MGTETIKSWIKRFSREPSNFNKDHLELNKIKKEKRGSKKLVLVGNPNVGKSLLFNRLTGAYITVSNYPGTTVTSDRGSCDISGESFDIVDSPGMYSLSSITEDERIPKLMLLEEEPDIILHVADAKNLERMLPLTLQLIGADLPIILVLNMIDEAEEVGLRIDHEKLEKELGIPVVPTAATTGRGVAHLINKIGSYKPKTGYNIKYNETLESAVNKISTLMEDEYPISLRSLSLLLLQQDEDVEKLVKEKDDANYNNIKKIVNETASKFRQPLNYLMKLRLQGEASEFVSLTLKEVEQVDISWREKLSRVLINPLTGVPVLLVIMAGIYLFVGSFGTGVLAGLVEETIFGEWINPQITDFVVNTIPYVPIQELFVGENGVWTLGVTYAIGMILPIITTFFLAFSILEDSGYLPRLALLIDRAFKRIGLSGRAVIPMVLALGCGATGTLVTRTLQTERERAIATLLMALAIPCAGQLGVVFGVLAIYPNALWLWALVILFNYVMVGSVASKRMPGDKPTFYMELPPLRVPRSLNVIKKTYARLIWYMKEVLPLFILVSSMLWLLMLTGILDIIIALIAPVVNAIGLPVEASRVFILGFIRKDFGVAGLYDMQGALTGVQLLVAAIVLTLFMPCIVQFMVMVRERGVKLALLIAVFIITFAFTIGFIVNMILTGLGVVL